MRLYQLLTILLVFSLPFSPKQFTDDRIKYLIMLFSICLLPIFFPALLNDIKRRFIPTFCFLVFLIPLAIATIFSIDTEQSVVQLRLFLSYFVIFVSSRSIFPTFKSKELLTTYYLLLTTILSIISLYNTLIRHYVSKNTLSFLWVYFGHNHLSSLLVFAIPLCLYLLLTYWENNKISPSILAAFSLLVISLLFTFSIGAMIALALSFPVALLFVGKTFPLKKIFFIVFLIVASSGILSLYLFSQNKGIKTFNFRKNPPANIEARFTYWQAAFDNFRKNPLTGTGLNTFTEALVKFAHTQPIKNIHFTSDAHNFFIQMLTDSGIFGFLGSIALIGAVLGRAYNTIKTTLDKRERLFYFSLFIGLLSSTLLATIDVDWHLPTVFLFFWIFAGLLNKHVN